MVATSFSGDDFFARQQTEFPTIFRPAKSARSADAD
jgi:hypothetical protein